MGKVVFLEHKHLLLMLMKSKVPMYLVQVLLWKLPRFSLLHFWQKFRESNVFTNKEITKELI